LHQSTITEQMSNRIASFDQWLADWRRLVKHFIYLQCLGIRSRTALYLQTRPGHTCAALISWCMSCSWCSMRQIADADKDWITYLMSAITAENCSGDVACGDVETNRTKYSCWSRRPGRFELAIYILMCLLYCFERLPDTSSHHKGSMITYNSLLPARCRSSFGILGTFVPAA
jgi:hypothetical protein